MNLSKSKQFVCYITCEVCLKELNYLEEDVIDIHVQGIDKYVNCY